MQRVHSSEPLRRFTYNWLDDGSAVVYLRDNIEEVTVESEEGTYKEWIADEVVVETTLCVDEIEENFDVLWVQGENRDRGIEARLATVEELLDATMAVVLEGEV